MGSTGLPHRETRQPSAHSRIQTPFFHPEATAVAVRTSSGEPCCEGAIGPLKILAANHHILGILRETKVRRMERTVPMVRTPSVRDPRGLIDPLAEVQSFRTPGSGRQRRWPIGCTCPRTP